MKNTIKKISALILALAMTAGVGAAAFAEKAETASKPAAPAIEEKIEDKKPEPTAEPQKESVPAVIEVTPAPAAAETETPAETEAPAESAVSAESETPAATETPADPAPTADAALDPTASAEPTPDSSADPTVEPSVDPTADPSADPTAEPTPEAPVAFTGSVEIKLENQGAIYFGDTVTLRAIVHNANTAYSLRWEVYNEIEGEWQAISGETGERYQFVVTEENADDAYRVVVITEA